MEYQKLAHWFSQNYQWIFSGIGVLIVALLSQRFVSRNEAKHESRSTTKVDGSSLTHSPVATGQGIKQSVTTQTFHAENIHIGRAVAAPTPTQPSKSELAIPNFIYAGAKRKDVFVNPWPREGICDPITEDQRTKSIPAFVLKFENRVKAGRKISRALNVIAKLKFRHKEGATARDTDYGVWLNSPCNSTDMGIGDTRELVLVYDTGAKFMTFEDKRSDNRDYYSEGFSYFHLSDVSDYEWVDITLIDQNTQATLSVTLRFWRDGENIVTSQM